MVLFGWVLLVVWGQSVTEEIGGLDTEESGPPLATEKIVKISASGRILLLSNHNNAYAQGDFISLLLYNKLVLRCLVAKIKGHQAGVKITKIYHLELWKKIRPDMKVQVLRGDDSYFAAQKNKKKASPLIQEEEDLYNKTVLLEDNLDLEETTNRIIKTDNIMMGVLGLIEGVDIEGNIKRYNQISGSWMYQIVHNIWAEVGYGQSVVNDFPNLGLDTKLVNLSFKLKYTIKAPFFSYVQPYAGFQRLGAISPGAGVDDGNTPQDILDLELYRIDGLKRETVIFGVSVLKRLVPGWLGRVDVGSDMFSFGFGLEF